MYLKNRIHTATRWPCDRRRRAELARTTLDFIDAMERVYNEAYFDEPTYAVAYDVLAMRSALTPLFRAAVDRISISNEIGGEG